MLAVLFLDLDNFKSINDTLGHDIGDELLTAVANRLKDVLREEDTLSRQGGDEFTILIPHIEHRNDLSPVADKILQAINEPFRLAGHDFHITTCIGVSLFPLDGKDTHSLT